MLNLSKPTALLFDLGDTLIHGNFTAGETEAVWQEIYNTIINPENDLKLPTLAQLRQEVANNVGKAMAYTWKHKVEEEMDIIPLFAKAFAAAGLPNHADTEFIHRVVSLEQAMLYKRIVEVGSTVFATLQTLRESGYRLGMVSNFCNIPAVVRQNLQELGLLQYFDEVVISCEIGWRKPSARVYQTICQKLELAPEACLFIGDRLIEDVQGPQRAGMRAILTHEFRQEPDDPAIQPEAVITRLEQILQILG